MFFKFFARKTKMTNRSILWHVVLKQIVLKNSIGTRPFLKRQAREREDLDSRNGMNRAPRSSRDLTMGNQLMGFSNSYVTQKFLLFFDDELIFFAWNI